jgi:hypothetical protein
VPIARISDRESRPRLPAALCRHVLNNLNRLMAFSCAGFPGPLIAGRMPNKTSVVEVVQLAALPGCYNLHDFILQIDEFFRKSQQATPYWLCKLTEARTVNPPETKKNLLLL